jgi:hypothetical protein
MSALHLRPRGFSELIDASFHIVRARLGVLVTGAAIIMVPIMAITLLSTAAASPTVLAGTDGTTVAVGGGIGGATMPAANTPIWFGLAMIPLAIVAIAAYVIGFGALVHVAERAYLGESVDLGPAFARARRRFWSLLRAAVTKYVRAMGLFMLVAVALAVAIPAMASGGTSSAGVIGIAALLMPVTFIVAIVLLLRWCLTAPVVMYEDVGGKVALERSAKLTKGAKGRLFGIFLVLLVLVYATVGTLMWAGTMLTQNAVVGQVVGNLASLVTYPFAAVLVTVIYFDLRIRNEGFDLELMAGSLADQAVLPPAPSRPSRQPA